MRGMVIRTSRRSLTVPHAVRFALLALGGLLLGHEAVYAVYYGLGAGLAQAMSAGGHDTYWPMFSTLALSGLLLLLTRGVWRLSRLRTDASQPDAQGPALGPRSTAQVRSYRQELRAIWPALFAVVAVAYLVQENLEHLLGHGHLPGLAPLIGPEAPLALPVLAAVTLALAALGALLRWRIAVLEARLALLERRRHPRPRHQLRPAARWVLLGAVRATFWSLVRQGPVRAPPAARFA